jgi:hypothetical protein
VIKKSYFSRKKDMTREEFLAIAESQWEAINSLEDEKSFYEYEKRFESIWLSYGRTVLEKSISDPEDSRKKKADGHPNGDNSHLEQA